MLLRSSSTPVLGSLLSSFSESPNRDFENSNGKHPPSSDHNLKKISFSHGGIPHFSSFACNSSPISHGESNAGGARGFRRAQSDGNLEGLAAASCDMDEFQISNLPTRSSRKPSISVLQTIPSFSIYNSREYEDEDENDPDQEQVKEEDLDEKDGSLARSVTIGDNIIAIGSAEFNFEKYKSMGSILEEEINSGVDEEREQASLPLYLARGIGIDGLGFGNAVFTPVDSGLDGSKAEEHYKRMVEENPCNPLFLRNYAQFLYQSKGDLRGAEEYYSRAILLDPGDGEILSQYAKLVWELHHDHERASSYFERAVQFAPEDSHVLAAYASFLWETEDEEEEDSQPLDLAGVPVNCSGVMASASA